MNPSDKAPFSGVYAAALTPMHEDFSCNHKALFNHCSDLINRGCKGVVLFGTTGEGPSFSVEEREQSLKSLVKLGMDPQKLILGISCCAVDDVVRLIRTALEQNCSAVLIAPPFFYKNTEEAGIITFYREIIKKVDTSDLKIILYHIPQLSGVSITLNIIKTLRQEFPNHVIGIKESEGNLSFTKEILSTFPGFKVYAGKELHISEAVQLGAAGGINGIANAYPELICSLYAFGKDEQKPNNTEAIQHIAHALKAYPTLPAIKNIVKRQKGDAWHVMRPPLTSLDEKQSQSLMEALKNCHDTT